MGVKPKNIDKEARANHDLKNWIECRAQDPRPLNLDDVNYVGKHLRGSLGHLADSSDSIEIVERSLSGAINLFEAWLIPELQNNRLLRADSDYADSYGRLAAITMEILARKLRNRLRIDPAQGTQFETGFNNQALTVDAAEAFLKHLKTAQSGRQAKLAAQAARSVRSRAG